MTVAVVGSREVGSDKPVRRVLDSLDPGTVVVSGGQPRGVDGFVDELLRHEAPYKDELGYEVYPPKHYSPEEYGWDEGMLGQDAGKYGQEYHKKHYRERNLKICLAADKMVAIKKDGAKNKGTGIAVRMFEEVNGEEPLVVWT